MAIVVHLAKVVVAAGAALALVLGVLGGLVRIGWTLPAPPSSVVLHGVLLVGGFLATVIGLERAAARGDAWRLAAPVLSATGAVAGLAGAPWPLVPVALAASGLVLLAATWPRAGQMESAVGTMLIGAACWTAGALIWLAGRPQPVVVWWWAAFLVLTVAGERLELSRLRRRPPWSGWAFAGCTLLLVAGLVTTVVDLALGVALVGAGFTAFGGWLLAFDLARATVRRPGVTRYVAICLLIGHGWLTLGGLVPIVWNPGVAGPLYDAALHAVLVGFVLGMVFGHAPIILPALTGLTLHFHRGFYLPLAVLHGALLLRLVGDLAGLPAWRTWGGIGNALALVLFAVTVAAAVLPGTRAGTAATRGER